jgi:ABC-2 type transport system ATP-binding protein
MASTLLREPNTAREMPIDDAAPSWTPELRGRDPGSVPALLVDRVTKRFNVARWKEPVIAISDVSLRLERGGTIGILGANGSGKSTLIRLVSGLLTLDEGRVEVFGHDLEREEMAVKRLINRVSVDAAFFKKLSPMENLLFAARLYGIDAKLARRNTVLITERLGIAEKRLSRPVEQMSRGMQQKIAIARALLTSPALLLLDEPTTGLDPQARARMWDEIRGLREAGTTVFLTTHYLEEADALADRLAIIDHGRIVAEGTADELKREIAGDVITIGVDGAVEHVLEAVRAQPFVREATADDDLVRLYVDHGDVAVPNLIRVLDGAGLRAQSLTLARPSLDDVFLRQTGRSLREEPAA